MRARPPPLEQLWDRFTAFAVKVNEELSHLNYRLRRLEQRLERRKQELEREEMQHHD